jgi:predicted ATP-binding protein involved in virulence
MKVLEGPPTRLDRLEVRNFWGFDKFTLDLNPKATVIVGPNGAGKSAIVDAMRVALEVVPDKFGYTVQGIGHDNVREVWSQSDDSGAILRQYPSQVTARGRVMGSSASWFRRLAGPKSRGRWTGTDDISKQINTWSQAHPDERENLPLVALYDVGRKARTIDSRLLTVDNRALLDRRELTSPRSAQLRPLDAYEGCLFDPERFSAVIGWIRQQTMADQQEHRKLPALQGVLRTIAKCLVDVEAVWYSLREERLMAEQRGLSVPVDKLSDGYVAVLGVAADIAWRCVVLNRHLGDQAGELTAGVVVIDEIDLHLHPRWQRRVLRDLVASFPKIQFIVTTHSPQVIASCEPEWLRVLVPAESGAVTVERVEHAKDLDTNWLLNMVMGAEERPMEAEAELEKMFRAISFGNLADARCQLAQFRKKWPANYPEVLRAQRLIALAERK